MKKRISTKPIHRNDEGIVIEVSLGLSFTMINNTTEYHAFLAGLRIAKDIGAKRIKICIDSKLLALRLLLNIKSGKNIYKSASNSCKLK